jgi:hypothetical protein
LIIGHGGQRDGQIADDLSGRQHRELPAAGGASGGGDVKLFLNGQEAQSLGDLMVALTALECALLVWYLRRQRNFLRV